MKINKRLFNGLKKWVLGILLIGLCCQAWAFDAFVVKRIRVQGLHRIQLGTVLNYLPLKTGQTINQHKTATVLHKLYGTGFFSTISLARDGNTLIIKVVERPTIGSINVSGNKDISKDKMEEILKNVGLVEGKVYNRSVLERVQESLKEQYNNRGKYNAKIKTHVAKLTRNRVAITVMISEGAVAKIKKIKIIGNHAFREQTLRHQFALATTNLFSYFTGKDQYSKERLEASLEALRSYYMDRGYLKISIEATQISITPDHQHVYITVSLKEGPLYTFKGYKLTGKFVVPKAQLEKVVTIKAGDVFSRKTVSESINAIGNVLGDHGYGMPQINAHPTIDEKTKKIFLAIAINPGKQVYVRRITFTGNSKTADYVLRHAMRQHEGSLLSLSKIKESERQLRVTGYFQNVKVKSNPVPGKGDQVDLNYQVTERSTAKISVGGGFASGGKGFIFNASIDQPNFLGTGKSVGAHFSTDNLGRYYSVNYYNPYATIHNVGRGFELYFQQARASSGTDITNYRADRYGGMLHYNIPFSDRSSFQWGLGYDHYKIGALRSDVSTQVRNFVALDGNSFNHVRLNGSWAYNSYDTYAFPTQGLHQELGVLLNLPGGGNSLSYYKINYKAHYYHPISHGFIFSLFANLGYGNSFEKGRGLPFYENYYAGGTALGQVRGYDNYSLGPRDSKGETLGGNILVSGTAEIILPHPLSRETIRTSVFVDAGQVFQSGLPTALQGTDPGPMRFSAGVAVVWRSPFGTFELSVAKPLNSQCVAGRCDTAQTPQFNITTGF